ncbi:MAG: hypothetical protein R3B09_22190 [Nannocystaceae bacterium]
MTHKVILRVGSGRGSFQLQATLIAAGEDARASFDGAAGAEGGHLLLSGDRDFHVQLDGDAHKDDLVAAVGARVSVRFVGRRGTVRRRLAAVAGRLFHPDAEAPAPQPESFESEAPAPAPTAAAIDLTSGIFGARPLFLLGDGTLAAASEGPAPQGMDALAVMETAARWVSSRRTSSFERLFPESPFHPDLPVRDDRLSVAQAGGLLDQLERALAAAAVGGEGAAASADDAAQLRSACLTVLAHVIATAARDPEFRAPADRAFAAVRGLIEGEDGAGARPEIRAHAIQLLSQRGPALTDAQKAEVRGLLKTLTRSSPPYDEIKGPWRIALNAGYEFNKGGVEILRKTYKFTDAEVPADAPKAPGYGTYVVLQAPFTGPDGQVIQIFARAASPRNENAEMESEYFVGVAINRHANLGSADMSAALVDVRQRGYKLMLNAQCAGLTTRFAISRMFPEADIFSSWDSTYFRTGADGELSASEGIDCLMAILKGMSQREDFTKIEARVKAAQWYHSQSKDKSFVQFIGPANPLVTRRYEDVNRDGKADYYDGFLDLRLVEIAEDLRASATPRDPGAQASQISGAAASGLGWAAGSLNRVTQYSDLFDELPGQTELFYAFRSGGFFSEHEPPQDVPLGRGQPVDLGLLPAVVRYLPSAEGGASLSAEVMFNSWLSHAAQELKRLLCAADASWRAVDLGYRGARAPIDTPAGQRAGLLLVLAGLLEFPADQNMIDVLWGMALEMLGYPKISRSVIRRCITEADHDAGNYYGSVRGVRELLGEEGSPGKLESADPLAHTALLADDPAVGRAKLLDLAPPAPTSSPNEATSGAPSSDPGTT